MPKRYPALDGLRGLAIVFAVFLVCALLFRHSAQVTDPRVIRTDADLYALVIANMKAGAPYYQAATAALTAGHYRLSGVFNWRPPLLAEVEARVPLPIMRAILVTLALSAAWLFHRSLTGTAVTLRLVTLVIGASSALIALDASAVLLHEPWAGVLIAISLAEWPRHRTASIAFGMLAACVRELALPYLVLMALSATLARQWREARDWTIATLSVSVLWLLHIMRARAFVAAGPIGGWLAWGGFSFAFSTFRTAPIGLLLPTAALVMLVPIALIGLWFLPTAQGRRIAMVVSAYAAAFCILGRADEWYWGAIIAPLWPLGIVGVCHRFTVSTPSPVLAR